MDCRAARVLVEKLADGEATDREALEAEAHLEMCESCRSDLELLRAMAAAASRPQPEPPPGYFEDLPGRLLARIDEEEAPPSSSPSGSALSSGALRFWALAATVVVAVAAGLIAQQEGLLEERQAPAETGAPSPAAPEPGATVSEELAPAEPEAAPEPPLEEAPAVARDQSPPAPEAPASPAPRQEGEPVKRARVAEQAEEAEPGLAPNSLRATGESRIAGLEEGAGARSATAAEAFAKTASDESDCERWRRYLEETVPSSDEAREARYRLARCSLDRFTRLGTDEARAAAIADAEAFLEVEDEGSRADAIRGELARLR